MTMSLAMNLELHPLCTLFPRLVGAEFEALKADIIANGLREPIVVHKGFILDGGNRYRACVEAGVEPTLKEFGGDNLVSFVLSANLHRRHLSPGQQAAIVASAQDWSRAQGFGGDRKSDQGATLHLDSVADRSAQSGASVRTQKMADKVAKVSPELAKKVAHGEISLPKAHEQVVAPHKQEAAPPAIPKERPADADLLAENARLVEEMAELSEFIATLQANLKETLADNEMMGRVFDADDRLKAAMDEAKRQKAIAENAERTLAAKSGEFIERARAVTYWKNRAEKAEKKLAALEKSA